MIRTKEMISQYVKLLKPKEVLDLGCGNGKISLRFAEMGANITGVDKREEKYAYEKFNFVHQDIRDFKFNKEYDLIIASFVLHFLNNFEATEIIKKIKVNTEIGGYNFLICLSKKDDFYKKENFYPNPSELKGLYSDWEMK
ncbi:MAG: methyltransferase domain-containing protein [Candidatus Aenigmatarchaeota archaeon]